jgi:hypothetical protein
LAQLCDEDMVARREVDVVGGIAPAVVRMSLVSNGSLNENTTP